MIDDPFNKPSDGEILRMLWEDVQEIKAQVKTTNGRVTSLEKFRWAAGGGLAAITVAFPIIIYLAQVPAP